MVMAVVAKDVPASAVAEEIVLHIYDVQSDLTRRHSSLKARAENAAGR